MVSFNPSSLQDDVLKFLRRWVQLLSENRYPEAFAYLDISAEKNTIKDYPAFCRIINEYFNYKNWRITDPSLPDRHSERFDMCYYDDKSGFCCDYDLPVNNEWSDLTAQFSFKNIGGGLYRIYLENVHLL